MLGFGHFIIHTDFSFSIQLLFWREERGGGKLSPHFPTVLYFLLHIFDESSPAIYSGSPPAVQALEWVTPSRGLDMRQIVPRSHPGKLAKRNQLLRVVWSIRKFVLAQVHIDICLRRGAIGACKRCPFIPSSAPKYPNNCHQESLSHSRSQKPMVDTTRRDCEHREIWTFGRTGSLECSSDSVRRTRLCPNRYHRCGLEVSHGKLRQGNQLVAPFLARGFAVCSGLGLRVSAQNLEVFLF